MSIEVNRGGGLIGEIFDKIYMRLDYQPFDLFNIFYHTILPLPFC